MADHAHRRPLNPPALRRRIWRRVRRSRYARHLPFTVYALITFLGMGWTLVTICRATA